MANENRLSTNGDIRVSVDGGQGINVNVGSGGLDSLGKRAFTVGVAESAAVTIDGDYRKLRHLPTINGVTIVGDLALEDLSLRAVYYDTTANFDALGGVISKNGALYIYKDYIDYVDDEGVRITIPGIRVGDGVTPLPDLQFAGGGSASGGTTNYNALRNKPKINGVTLQGDVGLEELSLKAVFYASSSIWEAQDTLIPAEGDIYIYSDYKANTDPSGVTSYTPAIKIGDGMTLLSELLPIVSYDAEDAKEKIVTYLRNEDFLVSASDRKKWNEKKLRVEIDQNDEECIRFYYS